MTNGSSAVSGARAGAGTVLAQGGHRVLFVMATRVEYLEALSTRFDPFICGVGPVEAAASTASRLAAGDVDLVVSLGSAGSAQLPQGHVAQVSHVSYRDMDASAIGFERGVTPFLDLPAVVALPLRIPGLATATLATGASIVSGAGYEAIAADMVDMESWAVLRACRRAGLEMVGLRAVSDGSEPLGGYRDWADHLPQVDRALAAAVDRLLEHLAA